MNKEQAAKAKAEWLTGCLSFGWQHSELDALSAVWDRFKDENGNLRPKVEPPSPGEGEAVDWKAPDKELPTPMKLTWIKRRGGSVYIGYRLDKPLATNPDASRDCWWYGNSTEEELMCEKSVFNFHCHFSDVTVTGWRYVWPPISSNQNKSYSLDKTLPYDTMAGLNQLFPGKVSKEVGEQQAEWEFVQILQTNYNAAKSSSADEDCFAGTTKKEAVIEIYEDLLEIIKGLPLKRTGSVEPYLKSIDALAPAPPAAGELSLEKVKFQVAKSKGYPSWREMYDWVCRDGQYPVVVAQLIEGAMDEVIEICRTQPPAGDKMRTELLNILGTVNFSSHKQMREAIEGAMELLESQPPGNDEWVKVEEGLPYCYLIDGKKKKINWVLAVDGGSQCVCIYTKGHEIEYGDDDPQDSEVDEVEERNGCLYLKPGWYELEETPGGEFDETWVKRTVTHWRYLPTPPNKLKH